jgi:hypothetical protein
MFEDARRGAIRPRGAANAGEAPAQVPFPLFRPAPALHRRDMRKHGNTLSRHPDKAAENRIGLGAGFSVDPTGITVEGTGADPCSLAMLAAWDRPGRDATQAHDGDESKVSGFCALLCAAERGGDPADRRAAAFLRRHARLTGTGAAKTTAATTPAPLSMRDDMSVAAGVPLGSDCRARAPRYPETSGLTL